MRVGFGFWLTGKPGLYTKFTEDDDEVQDSEEIDIFNNEAMENPEVMDGDEVEVSDENGRMNVDADANEYVLDQMNDIITI